MFFATWKSLFFLDMHFFDNFGVPSLMESICHQLRMTGASWHGLPAPPGTTGRLQWLPLPLPNGKCLSRFGCLVLIVVFKSVGLKFLLVLNVFNVFTCWISLEVPDHRYKLFNVGFPRAVFLGAVQEDAVPDHFEPDYRFEDPGIVS